MLRKLSAILALATLCTNMGIVAPVSAQAETEERILIESNFQNCNPGAYTEENQKGEDGETDLRNGIVMVDDNDLSTGYTIKNGDAYEAISEADIVMDDGTKVLRLNTFLDTYKLTNKLTEEDANYPVVKSIERVPKDGKVRIDLELKTSPRAYFYLHHSKPVQAEGRIWRIQNGNATSSEIRVLSNTSTKVTVGCDKYHTHTAILDTATGHMKIYLDGAFIWETTEELKAMIPTWDQELFFRQDTPDLKPTVTYNTEDTTKIESVLNPQYVYVKSLKMTTYTDMALESVTPEDGSKLITPKEAVFKFNSNVSSVAGATVTGEDGVAVDVKASLAVDGKTITVPYNFEDDTTYTVALKGVSDGITSTDAVTTFMAESWKFSNVIKTPVASSTGEEIVYFINEDFEAASDSNLISPENTSNGWGVSESDKATITELPDGTKALQLANKSTFSIQYDKKLGLLDNTTTLSYDVFIGEKTKYFYVDREDYSPSSEYHTVAKWKAGVYENGEETAEMSAGEWHEVMVTISDKAGTTIFVDGSQVMKIDKDSDYIGLSETGFFRFRVNGDNVLIDNLKLYVNKKQTVLTGVNPAFNGTDVSLSAPIEFTYSNEIGDVSGAKLIVKPNDTDEATEFTNGNGMSVIAENNTVKVVLDNALGENLGYAVELSGIKDEGGKAVSPVRTRFSTVYDADWEVKNFESTAQSASSKKYSIMVKNATDAAGALMAVAVYDENGYLEEVVFSEPAISGNDWVELNATVNYAEGNVSKIFIWDSLAKMNLISGIITD